MWIILNIAIGVNKFSKAENMSKSYLIYTISILLLFIVLWKVELIPHGYIVNESTTIVLELKLQKVDESSSFNHSLEFHGGDETIYKSWFGNEYTEFTLMHGYYRHEEYELISSDTDILRISNQEIIPVMEGNVIIHAITDEGRENTFLVQIAKINDSLIPEVLK
jgi:hypothetical protein